MKLRALGVALATLGLVVTASPAHAAVHRHSDASADATQATCTKRLDDPTLVEADCTESVSSAAEPDIIRTAIRYERANVVVRIRQRDITRAGIRGQNLRIVTNEGVGRHVETVALPGSARLMKEMTNRRGKKVSCSGLRASMDPAANLVTITVPRSCMSYPRWVRVGIGAWTISDDAKTFTADDAFLSNRVGERLVLSPVVRRN